jgi:hypothetical protein
MYARTSRLRISAHTDPQPFAQGCCVQLLPDAVDPPSSPEVMMNGLPRRELLVGQQTPGTATTTHNVEDGVKDLAQGMYPGPPISFRGRQVRLYALPLGIGEVGRVRLSHAC